MRKTLFETIYYEEFITVNVEKNELIGKIREMQGFCTSDDANDNALSFSIDKKGAFAITSPHLNSYSHARSNYLKGKVIASKNDTSIVYMKCLHSNIGFLCGIGIMGLLICVLLFCIIYAGFSWLFLFLGSIFGVIFLPKILRSTNEDADKFADFEIMKEEILKRIEAVENWDK